MPNNQFALVRRRFAFCSVKMKLLVIGISGITGGGKTVLATGLYEYLNKVENRTAFKGYQINTVKLLQLDAYFYPRDSPNHTWIKEINYINRELVTAMDMERFVSDAEAMVTELNTCNLEKTPPANDCIGNALNILIIEGYFIFKKLRIRELCNMRLHINLPYNVGLERRLIRTFKHVNPKPVWYYEHIIWPSYQQYLNEIGDMFDLIIINGDQTIEAVFNQSKELIRAYLCGKTENG